MGFYMGGGLWNSQGNLVNPETTGDDREEPGSTVANTGKYRKYRKYGKYGKYRKIRKIREYGKYGKYRKYGKYGN